MVVCDEESKEVVEGDGDPVDNSVKLCTTEKLLITVFEKLAVTLFIDVIDCLKGVCVAATLLHAVALSVAWDDTDASIAVGELVDLDDAVYDNVRKDVIVELLEIDGVTDWLFVNEVQALTDDEPLDVIYALCVGNDEEEGENVEEKDSLFVDDIVFAITECETNGETE